MWIQRLPFRGPQQAQTCLWIKIPPHVNDRCGSECSWGSASPQCPEPCRGTLLWPPQSLGGAGHPGCPHLYIMSPHPARCHLFLGGREEGGWRMDSLGYPHPHNNPKQRLYPKVPFAPQVLKVLCKWHTNRDTLFAPQGPLHPRSPQLPALLRVLPGRATRPHWAAAVHLPPPPNYCIALQDLILGGWAPWTTNPHMGTSPVVGDPTPPRPPPLPVAFPAAATRGTCPPRPSSLLLCLLTMRGD